MAIILSNLNRFSIFFSGSFLGKFAVKTLLKIPPRCICCHTTMWNNNIRKRWITRLATYLRCGWLVNNQIKKGLLLGVNNFFKSVNIWQSYKQERGCCLVYFLCLLADCSRSAADFAYLVACKVNGPCAAWAQNFVNIYHIVLSSSYRHISLQNCTMHKQQNIHIRHKLLTFHTILKTCTEGNTILNPSENTLPPA